MRELTGSGSATSYTATRIQVYTGQHFDGFIARLESAVPLFSPEQLEGADTWAAVARLVETMAPHNFVFFFQMTPSNAMRIAGSPTRSRTYLMGNPVTVERMYKHHPGVMVHAPLHVEVYETARGRAMFLIERPSAAFGSFGMDAIAEVGLELDRQVDDLLAFLGVPGRERAVLTDPGSLP